MEKRVTVNVVDFVYIRSYWYSYETELQKVKYGIPCGV